MHYLLKYIAILIIRPQHSSNVRNSFAQKFWDIPEKTGQK